MTPLEALHDPRLFARWFQGTSWAAWRALLAALFALPMDDAALEVYRQHTGRTTPPAEAAREAWLVIGRRGGKSIIAALIGVYLATMREYEELVAGEHGTVMIIAADRRQARVILAYVAAFLDGTVLRSLVARRTKEAIHLTSGIVIEVHTASFRTTRGYTLIAAICDEVAFWRSDESANPDTEIIAALKPGLATVTGSLLLAISSPYARRGALWGAYERHYGKDGDPVVVWQAETRSMNPSVPAAIVEAALLDDEPAARAEWLAQFRLDVETFLSREAIEAVVIPDLLELPPVPGTNYVAFVDPSGGSSDSMTLAIAHADAEGRAVLDLIRERRPPFSPEDVVIEFAETLRSYHIASASGDRYAGEWPRERFQVHGIAYEIAEQPKSDLYRLILPVLNSRQVELLDHPKLLAQLLGLERRTARGGRDSIDHGPQAHDDLINAAAGALVLAAANAGPGPQVWALDARPAEPALLTSDELARLEARERQRLWSDAAGWKGCS